MNRIARSIGAWAALMLAALLWASSQPAMSAPAITTPTLNRPQNPDRPFPYREEEVGYVNQASTDKVRLAGTLTLPQGKGPFPAVILIAGSGPQNRDGAAAGHKLFLVLADHLTRRGIAVLRVDKRGVGASTGVYARTSAPDLASDVEAGLAFLRHRRDIDAGHIGLIGHSEGGLIAPMVAADDREVAFVILMAGPGENGATIALRQGELILRADGKSESVIAESTLLRTAIFRIVREEADPARRDTGLRRMLTSPETTARYHLTPSETDELIATFSTDAFHFITGYEPVPTLARLKQPVLAIGGSLDLQVSPGENLGAIRAALAHNQDATVTELPGLNHLFQPARTGSPSEYATIEQTIAPIALDTITEWILARVGSGDGSSSRK